MNTLCARLRNLEEAGIYQLNCSADELRIAAAQAALAIFEADLSAVQGKGEFLAAIAQAVKAPDWFGTNWDALADALGDFSWLNVSGSNVSGSNISGQPAAGYVLLLHDGGDTLGLSAADHKIVMEIFSGTVDFWKSQGKPFWIFFC